MHEVDALWMNCSNCKGMKRLTAHLEKPGLLRLDQPLKMLSIENMSNHAACLITQFDHPAACLNRLYWDRYSRANLQSLFQHAWLVRYYGEPLVLPSF